MVFSRNPWHKDYRNKEYSIKLMNYLFDEARKKGIKRMALDTPDREFFEKFGFKEVGRIPNWYEDKDQIIMFKNL
ncbi:MAG TPA: GNAT family N-acetyltransferase [Candidatus Pacearchaeota archaeon]|nr:GNAT family N-acetyltransferase [Candidatus Pacearchaeota archaeon]